MKRNVYLFVLLGSSSCSGLSLAAVTSRNLRVVLERLTVACGFRLTRSCVDALQTAEGGKFLLAEADIDLLIVRVLVLVCLLILLASHSPCSCV